MTFKITRRILIEESCNLDAETAEEAEDMVTTADYHETRRETVVVVTHSIDQNQRNP